MTQTEQTKTKKRGFFKRGSHWPFVIVGMLLAHASIMIGTIMYVGGKKDTYVDPEYYAKSVDWDAQRELKEAAENEGWQIAINAEPVASEPNQRRVRLRLQDADGNAIKDALVELKCYHPAEMSNRLDAVLLHDEAGTYTRTMPIDRTGIWIAEITIQRQGVRALLTKDLDVVSVPQTLTP